MRFPIIPRSKIFIAVGLTLAIFGFIIFFMNIRYSIQFTGGMEVTIRNDIDDTVLKTTMNEAIQQA